MPLVFVHGVNTRRGDSAAEQTAFDDRVRLMQEQFRVAFRERVATADRMQVFAPYWGDLGVAFGRGLASIPRSDIQALAINDPVSTALTSSIASKLDGEIVQDPALRENPLLTVARLRSLILAVDLLFVASAQAPTPDALVEGIRSALPDVARFAAAAEQYAAAQPHPAWLEGLEDDEAFVSRLWTEVKQQEAKAAPPSAAADPTIQAAGIGSDVLNWLKFGAEAATAAAGRVVDGVKTQMVAVGQRTIRAGFLELSEIVRPAASAFVGRFFGDVFKYIENRAIIQDRVLTDIRAALQARRTGDEELYLIGHSFGGIILYDLLTTAPAALDLQCDLFVTVGSQVALFAEIDRLQDHVSIEQAFAKDPAETVARPSAAKRWINIFDPTDLVSFGTAGVFHGAWDYRFDNDALPLVSHSAYFDTPRFFARLGARVKDAFATGTDVPAPQWR